MLFLEETNNRRRQIFVTKEIIIDGESELLAKLRELNIFTLSHGTIENYYPDGIIGVD